LDDGAAAAACIRQPDWMPKQDCIGTTRDN
jgi:hypothetical protein